MHRIREELNRAAEKSIQQAVEMLKYVGETVVNEIRTSHISDWTDQTGNLRSSIGYIVTVDGRPVSESDYAQVNGPKRGSPEDTGFDASGPRAYAHQVASQYKQGIALVIVAGMEYASFVERRDNKVVLAQGELLAKNLIDQMVAKLNSGTSR